MKYKYCLIITLFVTFISQLCSAQNSVVSVSPLTGALNMAIPIYTISRGAVSVPVNLRYNTNGVKIKDVEGDAGMGWNLEASGRITRELRGLPDDCKVDIAGNAMLGWLYNTNGTKINNFNIANGGSSCANETNDINYINNNFSDLSDTEPDIFTISAPGLSCQLVFDNSKTIRTIPYIDAVISPTYDATTGQISSFTITNDKGTVYSFSLPEQTFAIATLGSSSAYYFKNKFNQFKNGIGYNSAWLLQNITDVSGNKIVFNYTEAAKRTGQDDVTLYYGSTGAYGTPTTQYSLKSTVTPKVLTSIQSVDNNSSNNLLGFEWQDLNASNQTILSKISGSGINISLAYKEIGNGVSPYTRKFLSAFTDVGCSSPVNYKFAYTGESGQSGTTTMLPDSSSNNYDYWGYYSSHPGSTNTLPIVYVNPSDASLLRYLIKESPTGGGSSSYIYTLGNNDRSADPTLAATGTLSMITYPTGGTTSIVYQLNDFYDSANALSVQGAGVRVTQVTDYDGLNTGNNIVRNYTYTDPSTGRSSGRPVTLPSYAFTVPYTGTATGFNQWVYSTVLSATDLSSEDHSILYQFSKVSQQGGGSTLYQYDTQAVYGSSNATPGCSGCTTVEWAPTINYSARPTCVSYGAVKNDTYSYPFAPDLNYDFERGLIRKVIRYNDAGAEVAESSYEYQRTGNPQVTTALRFEDNGSPAVKSYAKYNIFTGTSELNIKITEKIFDSQNQTQAVTKTVSTVYGSAYHKLPTQVKYVNSDNSTLINNISYTKDYPGATGTNAKGIYNLLLKNVNIPVESYSQVQRGAALVTTKASLTLFDGFATDGAMLYMPSQQLSLAIADGISNFMPYNSAQTWAYDARYFPVANYTAYDYAGYLETTDNTHKSATTVLTDHLSTQPAALFKNAGVSEIGFIDFDSKLPPSANFVLSGSASGSGPAGSHAGAALSFSGTQTLSKQINRNTVIDYYVLSAWINSGNTAGNLNVTLTNFGGQTTAYTEPFASTGGTWKYFEWKVPVAAMASSFSISIGTNLAIGIDDVIFYPNNSEVNTFGYDPLTHFKTIATNTNGISGYYNFDQWGRLLYAYDQDKNIIEKKSYVNQNAVSGGLFLGFGASTGNLHEAHAGSPINFTAYRTPCITGITYSWDFGDGSSVVSGLDVLSQLHTYAVAGNYSVTLTESHPIYGTKSYTDIYPIIVLTPAISALLCQSGVTRWDNCAHASLNTVSCGSNPNDTSSSYYTISMSGSVLGTLTYQWQKSINNGVTWTNVGPNSAQYVIAMGAKTTAYWIRCVVTSSGGQTATSDYALFDVVNCQ